MSSHEIGAMLTSAESVGTSGVPESDPPIPATRSAAGIYGLIVAASVIAVVGSDMPSLPLAVAVIVTLIIYWLAEEYAALIEHTSSGHLPNWAHIRRALMAKWPLVSASFLPLATLLVARLLGAQPVTAAHIALVLIVALLMVHGWRAGTAAGLRGFTHVGMTLLAGGFGILMIVLKGALPSLH